jgi:hypothetical protein
MLQAVLVSYEGNVAKLQALSFTNREFKLQVQQNIVCRFAPEGRDVYSLAVLSLLRSSVGAQSLLPAPVKVSLPGFASNGARSLGMRS